MTLAYIGLGSNHKAASNLHKGIQFLRETFTVMVVSSVYESAPVNTSDSPPYLNAAVAIETDLQPQEIKALLVTIEDECGRVRVDADGKKSKVVTLDCDLLLYGDSVTSYEFNGKTYHLPHDDIVKHAHTAIPLADIAVAIIHPNTNQTIAVIAAKFSPQAVTRRDDIQI